MAFHENIIRLAMENGNFREVVYTGDRSQLVLMSIPPGGEIGMETHPDVDQILFFVEGKGEAIVGEVSSLIQEGDAVFVPAGTLHNFKNTDVDDPLKLYTVYSPPEHPEGTIHATKEEADAAEY